MIVSASRRTDIPAFYGEWFMNRVKEGFALVPNPFNPRQVKRVDLTPGQVDTIVFWTKNPAPMLPRLGHLDRLGYRYYFLYTLNTYPSVIEPFVPPREEAISAFRELSRSIGPRRVVWRFDPVLISDVTPEAWILENFSSLARELEGVTERVIVSFARYYRSVRRHLDGIGKSENIGFHDISGDMGAMRRIAKALADAARERGIAITSCAETHDLSGTGVEPGKCIDDGLIRSAFGIEVPSVKDRSQRPECGCVQSQDIGCYNTCVHGCVYCYAASRRAAIPVNRALHDPRGPSLVPLDDPPPPSSTSFFP